MNAPLKPKQKFIKIIFLLLSYVVVAVVVWKVTTKMQTSPEYQQQQVQKQVQMTLKKVSELTIVPTGETPQIAVIQDIEALKKNQPFFTDAENGDKVLIFSQARKAIIYRESAHKIINIALNIDTEADVTAQQKQAPTPVQTEVGASTTISTEESNDR